jgi:hypothetical protein
MNTLFIITSVDRGIRSGQSNLKKKIKVESKSFKKSVNNAAAKAAMRGESGKNCHDNSLSASQKL